MSFTNAGKNPTNPFCSQGIKKIPVLPVRYQRKTKIYNLRLCIVSNIHKRRYNRSVDKKHLNISLPGIKMKTTSLFTRHIDKLKMKIYAVNLKPAVDSRYSWAVCISSFILQFFVFGVNNSFGTLFLELLKDFKQSESATGKFVFNFLSSVLSVSHQLYYV